MSERGTALARWARAALLVLAPLLGLLWPQAAGVQGALAVPVRYARLELPGRAPALIAAALPKAVYTVSPASLGYFAPGGEFVYTADVARGLIYGRADDTAPVVVLELSAPPQAPEFIDDHLQRIRRLTRELNDRRNRLRLERLELEQLTSDPFTAPVADEFWAIADGDPPGDMNADWLAHATAQGTRTCAALTKLLPQQAAQRAKMKQQYYASYATRSELLLAQFDLQLALARLPRRSGEQLLPQPGALELAGLTQEKFARLRESWALRYDALQRLLALQAAEPPLPGEALRVTTYLPGAGVLPATGQGWPPASAVPGGDPAAQAGLLEVGCEAQRRVWEAELQGLEQVLAGLKQAAEYVDKEAGQVQENLVRHGVADAAFIAPGLSLRCAAQVEGLELDPPVAAWLLLKLNRLFEGGRGAPGPAAVEALFAELRPRGEELGCGIQAIDACLRRPPRPAVVPPGQTATPGTVAAAAGAPTIPVRTDLLRRLDEMLADPDSFGVAALDLGYLRFMRWYAQQESGEIKPFRLKR